MAKFQTINKIKDLVLPWVEKDSEGNIIRDQSISFNRGMNGPMGFIPAYLQTSDEKLINYLRSYPGNKANGGHSFEEVEVATLKPIKAKEATKKPEQNPPVQTEEAVIASPETVTTESPEVEEAIEANTTEVSEAKDSALKVFEEVTTVNEAGEILRTAFPELKTRDVNTKAKIAEVSASKGYSFPNL